MDFTRYDTLLSYLPPASSQSILDIMGQALASSAGHRINLREADIQLPIDARYDVILCRFVLSQQQDAFAYLNGILQSLKPEGYLIVQDYLMPDDERVADYINGIIHRFDKKHSQSFARYAWDGLLLDVGFNIQTYHQRSIHMTIQQWLECYQVDVLAGQQAQILFVQAPPAVTNAIDLRYQGTPYATFELNESVFIAQKEN